MFSQVVDAVDVGLAVLDRDLRIRHWNRWLQLHCAIPPDQIIGRHICDVFPNVNRPRFLNNCKAVFAFGNSCVFSQKLHRYLFPFKPASPFESDFEYMQQNCNMGPLSNEKGVVDYLFIAVHDVTETVSFEQKLTALNLMDGLTGICNRRGLEQRLKKEMDRHKRYGRPLSLMIFDLDHFKAVNDMHGHQCGDRILKNIAELIGRSIRTEDTLGRYGGEEFCCVMPETTMDAAVVLAERFRTKIAGHAFRCGAERISVTISLGVAAMSAKTATPDLLLSRAEDGLYMAKNRGCNRVEVAG